MVRWLTAFERSVSGPQQEREEIAAWVDEQNPHRDD
jgi:hypothetical protein